MGIGTGANLGDIEMECGVGNAHADLVGHTNEDGDVGGIDLEVRIVVGRVRRAVDGDTEAAFDHEGVGDIDGHVALNLKEVTGGQSHAGFIGQFE